LRAAGEPRWFPYRPQSIEEAPERWLDGTFTVRSSLQPINPPIATSALACRECRRYRRLRTYVLVEELAMSLLHPARSDQVVALWFVNDVPARLVYADERYRVTDTPTRLEDENPEMAQRLNLTGWRFQGTNEVGRSTMFDVRRNGDQWRLIRTYD
jgi:hypothetical protein